jgi:hypothetical protein
MNKKEELRLKWFKNYYSLIFIGLALLIPQFIITMHKEKQKRGALKEKFSSAHIHETIKTQIAEIDDLISENQLQLAAQKAYSYIKEHINNALILSMQLIGESQLFNIDEIWRLLRVHFEFITIIGVMLTTSNYFKAENKPGLITQLKAINTNLNIFFKKMFSNAADNEAFKRYSAMTQDWEIFIERLKIASLFPENVIVDFSKERAELQQKLAIMSPAQLKEKMAFIEQLEGLALQTKAKLTQLAAALKKVEAEKPTTLSNQDSALLNESFDLVKTINLLIMTYASQQKKEKVTGLNKPITEFQHSLTSLEFATKENLSFLIESTVKQAITLLDLAYKIATEKVEELRKEIGV